MSRRYQSWGRYPRLAQRARPVIWRDAALPLNPGESGLPFGNGRSYGDSCLSDGGWLLDGRGLQRFIAFDPITGILRCEAGVLLAEILDLVVPRGWFLPVTPGTRFVTVGGAIANDIHGKNHHRAGTLGHFVRQWELLRSDGTRLLCSAQQNPEWFRATIGGLGLTGMILWAEIALKPIASTAITVETLRFPDLESFFTLSAASHADHEYTVAWIDCLARGRHLGRGLLTRGNHAPPLASCPPPPADRWRVFLDPPLSLVNTLSLRLFNTLYYRRPRQARSTVHYRPFFYPLDAVLEWNRIYGPRGFLQYQCVVPHATGHATVAGLLERIAAAGTGSFLAVLKVFGDRPAAGLLSFPRPGVTLALDFPHAGAVTLKLLEALDEVVARAGGAVYPAKDARMSAEHFQQFFPAWQELERFRDPLFCSRFWRRATGVHGHA